jgi:hypothetical protein
MVQQRTDTEMFKNRLSKEALQLEEAFDNPPPKSREQQLRRQQAEMASNIDKWLGSENLWESLLTPLAMVSRIAPSNRNGRARKEFHVSFQGYLPGLLEVSGPGVPPSSCWSGPLPCRPDRPPMTVLIYVDTSKAGQRPRSPQGLRECRRRGGVVR